VVTGFTIGWYRANVQLTSSDGCSSTQTCVVGSGGSVTLQAPTNESYRFLGWGGCSTSTDTRLVLENLTQPQPMCAARYQAITHDVSWSVAADAPDGSVRLGASGPDFVCDASHCAVVLHQRVSLEAVPDDGASFVGWTGCSDSKEPRLTLSDVTADQHCEARFSR
jgi:Divergent InlB B-repeat domain